MPARHRSNRSASAAYTVERSPMLQQIRNMWEFANLCQWIYIFGTAANIDDAIDIDEMETECLKPQSALLSDIALALLKLISAHRGLNHEVLDEQLRKIYSAKEPLQYPLGNENNPRQFAEVDVFTKIKILQQLTQWTLCNPERLRDKMDEQKDTEQTSWRIEPYGWDKDDRVYYVLDDNRVYRYSEPPDYEPQPKPKKSRYNRSGRRSSRRHDAHSNNKTSFIDTADNDREAAQSVDNGLGGGIWECVAVTLQDVRGLLETFSKTRDENEKILRRQLEDHLIPILEKQEEAQKRRQLQREKELLNMAKMATAKRSSRLAGKAEKQKREEEERVQERHRVEAEEVERREAEAQITLEKEREFRLFARQRRLEEREARRAQHEEELAQLSEDNRKPTDSSRISERRLLAEIERSKQALKDLETEEDDWIFDCVCGLYGQIDDGSHSVACEKCNIWQHSKCLGISEEEAERAEFHFLCIACKKREDEKKWRHKPIIIKLKSRQSAGQDTLSTKPMDQLSSGTTTNTSQGISTQSAESPNKDPETAKPEDHRTCGHTEATTWPVSHYRHEDENRLSALAGSIIDINSDSRAGFRAHVDRPVDERAFANTVQQTLTALEPSSNVNPPRPPRGPSPGVLSPLWRTNQALAPVACAQMEAGVRATPENNHEPLDLQHADSKNGAAAVTHTQQSYSLSPISPLPSGRGNATVGGELNPDRHIPGNNGPVPSIPAPAKSIFNRAP